MENETEIISLDANDIKRRIFTIRGKQVMLDSDLAELYQVETKNLNKATNRNAERFPEDFRFKLTKEEYGNLRFQIGTSREEHGGCRYGRYLAPPDCPLKRLPFINCKERSLFSSKLHRKRMKTML